MSYLQNCPAGHYADNSECPYPADRSGKRFTVHCENGECQWEVIAPSKEQARYAWNCLPTKEDLERKP